ncbi:unnamed protein product [Hymenolepis diminuta]|uniref:F-box/kelch-repeat protein n=1 Tax=Hymenolepis diminuta TaxID=6216 RepID=A0A0R3SYN6_HYMDI|nr:unnamed protein product [Hymenolepis diminuta]
MIEERSWCAAVRIPDSGILVIGGRGRNRSHLRSTELLTRRSGEGESGGGENWQWLPFTPMNEEHYLRPLAVYFQGRVYVVGQEEHVNAMEMLDVGGSGQWTFLTSINLCPGFIIYFMAIVGNELFVKGY